MHGLIGLLLPTGCLVCEQPPHPCCPNCRPLARSRRFTRETPDHNPRNGPGDQVHGYSGGRYTPELSKLLGAFKDSGQLWLLGDLAPIAEAGLLAALESLTESHETPDFLTYIGSSQRNYRKRGYNPALTLLRAANQSTRLPIRRTVAPNKRVVDQASLPASDRLANLSDSLRPVISPLSRPARAVLFDDVVTTGSTLLAARRVLAGLNVRVVAVAALADVERRRPVSPVRDMGVT